MVNGLDADTDQSMRTFLDATLDMHRETLEAAIPRMMEGALGDLTSKSLSDYVQEASCPEAIIGDGTGVVDLRELLLTPTMSIQYGGEGKSPYGNLLSTVMDFFRDDMLAIDETTGLSKINEVLLQPLTKNQSGIEGTLMFDRELFDRENTLDLGDSQAYTRLRIANVFVSNIDSLGSPISLLDNVRSEAYLLNNSVILAENRSLDLGVRFLIELDGAGKFLESASNTDTHIPICRRYHSQRCHSESVYGEAPAGIRCGTASS